MSKKRFLSFLALSIQGLILLLTALNGPEAHRAQLTEQVESVEPTTLLEAVPAEVHIKSITITYEGKEVPRSDFYIHECGYTICVKVSKRFKAHIKNADAVSFTTNGTYIVYTDTNRTNYDYRGFSECNSWSGWRWSNNISVPSIDPHPMKPLPTSQTSIHSLFGSDEKDSNTNNELLCALIQPTVICLQQTTGQSSIFRNHLTYLELQQLPRILPTGPSSGTWFLPKVRDSWCATRSYVDPGANQCART